MARFFVESVTKILRIQKYPDTLSDASVINVSRGPLLTYPLIGNWLLTHHSMSRPMEADFRIMDGADWYPISFDFI